MNKFLWDNVEKKDSGCWECTLSTINSGYVQVGVQGKKWLAHRYAWFLTYGEIPEGMQVCHHCDNRICVRPGHLFLGTNQDNVTDMQQKLRHRYGETHHNAKLTDCEVEEMRASSEDYATLTERFGVYYQTVYKICKYLRRRSYG